MASGATFKVRFVRCPKCRLVLPEVPDVPVYKCGGCETILVAKNRQSNGQNIISLKETETSDTSKAVDESKHKEFISSNHKKALASNVEFLSDKENGNHQNTPNDFNEEQPDLILSNEGKQNGVYQRDRNSACLDQAGVESDGVYAKKPNGSVDCASKQLRVNLSKDEDEDEDEDKDEVGSKHNKFSHMHAHSPGVSNEDYSSDGPVHNVNEEQSSLLAGKSAVGKHNKFSQMYAHHPGVSSKDYSSNGLVRNDKEEQSSPLAGKFAVDINGLSSGIRGVKHVESNEDSKVVSLIIGDQITPGETGSTLPAIGPKTESISSDNLTCPDDEQLEKSQEINQHGISRITSMDTFYTMDAVGPSSELSGAFEYMSKSSTVRSSHTYEGSVSSFGGIDDHLADQRMDPFENSYEVPDHYVPGERTRRDKFLLDSMKSSSSKVHNQASDFSSDLSNQKHYGTKYKWHREKLIGHTMHNHPVRSWTRFGRAEYPYRVSIPQRDSFAGYESGSTSTQLHDDFYRRSNFHPRDEPENADKEKMKLLRMVYELQDQLQKSSFFNGRARSEDSWTEKQFPAYSDYEAPEKVLYPSYPERNMLQSNWSQQRKYIHTPLSGEAVNNRHQVDHSYDPRDWRSAPLPPRAPYHDRGFFMMHPDHGFYNSNSSWSSSPQRLASSEFPVQSYEVMSDDQRYRDYMVNKYQIPRGKPGTAKRHLRPTAGGAPLVACNFCMSLLQLPADFLLSKRGLHRLKCGACSTILKFSLENRIHLVPYEPIVSDPPKSQLDDYSDTMRRRSSDAYPMSSSDDYGVSFKSCSTEGEPSSVAPPHEPPAAYTLGKSRNKHKSRMEAYKSAGTSLSEPSEMEELPRRGGSPLGPLHRLMGYISVSQVFKGPAPVDSSKFSYFAGESSKS